MLRVPEGGLNTPQHPPGMEGGDSYASDAPPGSARLGAAQLAAADDHGAASAPGYYTVEKRRKRMLL